jgi:hypothetical protein
MSDRREPEFDKQGIPICSGGCPHLSGPAKGVCAEAKRPVQSGESVCRPAVADMAQSWGH